jgi:hypothetical protein
MELTKSHNDIINDGIDSVSTNVTNLPTFNPTPSMRLWLEKSIELMTDNISQIANECHLARQTWYKWCKQQGFNHWFNHEWEQYLLRSSWRLNLIGLKKAHEDYRYWAYLQDKILTMKSNPNFEPTSVEFILDSNATGV